MLVSLHWFDEAQQSLQALLGAAEDDAPQSGF
jgi:hypothetical protein